MALASPLRLVYIPQDATNEIYESRMAEALGDFQRQGISEVAFGDLFLADIREYRERWLSRIGIRRRPPIGPSWHAIAVGGANRRRLASGGIAPRSPAKAF